MNSIIPPHLHPHPTLKVRLLLYRHLPRFVSAGIPIVQGLKQIAASAPYRQLRKLALEAATGMGQGQSLSESLERAVPSLPRSELALIRSAEEAGRLVSVLDLLGRRCESKLESFRSFMARLIYPCFLAVFACFMLPLPKLIGSGQAAYWSSTFGNLLLLALLAGFIYVSFRFGPMLLDVVLRRLPGSVEKAILPVRRSDFIFALYGGLSSGIPLLSVLESASTIWSAEENIRAVRNARYLLEHGESLSRSIAPLLSSSQLFALSTAEVAGKLEETLEQLSAEQEKKSNVRRKLLSTAIAVAIVVAITATIAVGMFRSLKEVTQPSTETLKQLQRELRGTGADKLFEP